MSQVHNYEAVIILNPNTTEESQKKFFQNNKSTIEKFSGDVNHVDTWGQRHLASPIGKYSRGTYFHTTFTAGPNCISELERQFNINEDVLHYIHSRLDDRTPITKHLERVSRSIPIPLSKIPISLMYRPLPDEHTIRTSFACASKLLSTISAIALSTFLYPVLLNASV